MKKTLFILAVISFVFIGGINRPLAHCGSCNVGEDQHKVCTKCIDSQKQCMCKNKPKKPCEKKLGEKNWEEKKKAIRSGHVPSYNSKGSLIMRSDEGRVFHYYDR